MKALKAKHLIVYTYSIVIQTTGYSGYSVILRMCVGVGWFMNDPRKMFDAVQLWKKTWNTEKLHYGLIFLFRYSHYNLVRPDCLVGTAV